MGAFIPTYHYQKYCNEWSVQDLIPYTRYTFRISLFKDDIFIGHSAPSLVVTTLPGGRPSAPRLITINQINLDFINVTWLSPSIPKNRIIAYNLRIKELSTVTKNLYDATIDISVEEENVSMTPVYITYICQLPHINWIQQEKKIEYNISLYAINANGEDENWDNYQTACETRWSSRSDAVKAIHTKFTEIITALEHLMKDVENATTSQDEQISSLNEFVWPLDDYMLAVNTLPDTPLEPGIPYIFENGTYVILIWSGGDMNIDLYELYGKEINGDGNFYGWNLIYCDVKNFWPPSMLNDSVYKFKVRAKNEHGWSNFSQSIILNEFRDSFVSANNPLYNLIGENLSPIKHFSLSQLSFKTKLGSGAFGNVYEGTLQCSEHGSRNVALKTLKYNAKEITKKEFIKEALIMSKFNHPNILKLIGTCVDGGPTILVMELMEMDLLELLRSKRSLTDRSTILGKNLVRFCLDIARGCLYLTQMRHVHRDIAARNCLVSLPTSDHTHLVKIGDFGRAREIYRDDYYRKGGLMPIRWMAPESLEDGVYTHQTDVWSYGIVLWEIISFGKQPYPGMSHLDVYHYVCNLRKTLDVPLKCPHILYQLMTQCWSYEPINRPSFKECVDEIEELLLYKDELNGISFTEHIHQLESNSYTKKILNPATLSVTESNVPYLEVISSNNMITNI
ncbi:ROS1 [Lepeophtheirus salmonis]|uniref:receptor protein-tyrosine kinase n=1 Tax=Lepeophtheirus salmonis TaxID=72036 RepID=A0A7R8CGE8_LEPSM|nr:ROS1 [Lepeophtheirus salmonis]CAF2815822.1 ROS1 [Lepeophtheirus salmonis]